VLGCLRSAATDNRRGPPLAAGFGENQGAVVEIKSGQPDLTRRLGTRRFPVQPAGDHEVQDQKQILFQLKNKPLTQAAQPYHGPALDLADVGLKATQQEGMFQPYALQPPAHDPALETFEINDDIGKLRHATTPPLGSTRSNGRLEYYYGQPWLLVTRIERRTFGRWKRVRSTLFLR